MAGLLDPLPPPQGLFGNLPYPWYGPQSSPQTMAMPAIPAPFSGFGYQPEPLAGMGFTQVAGDVGDDWIQDRIEGDKIDESSLGQPGGEIEPLQMLPMIDLGFQGGGRVSSPVAPSPRVPPVAPPPPRISTRFPTAVGATENPLTQQLSIGSREFLTGFDKPGALEHNTGLLASYPGFGRLKGGSPQEITEGYVDQTAKNLRAVMRAIPDDIAERSSLWYPGANVIANNWAKEFNLHPNSTAGALASLSPQKDWFQNVDLARRVTDTVVNRADTPMSRQMLATQPRIFSKPEDSARFAQIKGSRLSDSDDPIDQAMWVRLWDE